MGLSQVSRSPGERLQAGTGTCCSEAGLAPGWPLLRRPLGDFAGQWEDQWESLSAGECFYLSLRIRPQVAAGELGTLAPSKALFWGPEEEHRVMGLYSGNNQE